MTGPARPMLTDRQLEVLRLLAHGLTHAHAARHLGVSSAALNDRLKEATRKLGALSTPHAVLLACRAGLLREETVEVLSPAFLEVIRLAAAGRTNVEIAAELGIAVDTVKWRLHQAYRQLGTDDRAHAAVICVRLGLIDRSEIELPPKLLARLDVMRRAA